MSQEPNAGLRKAIIAGSGMTGYLLSCGLIEDIFLKNMIINGYLLLAYLWEQSLVCMNFLNLLKKNEYFKYLIYLYLYFALYLFYSILNILN